MTTEVRCDFCNTIKELSNLYRLHFWEYRQLSTRMGHRQFLRLDMYKDCFKKNIKR